MADEALTTRMHNLQKAALSHSTRRAYRSGTRRYIAFCKQYSITPFPTSESTLCYFIAYLSDQVQYATARLYLAAVRAEHLKRGWKDPLKHTHQLTALLRGLQKTAKYRVRKPITPKLLNQLLHSLLSNRKLHKQDRYLYATAFSIAYFGCLRAGEISYTSTRSYNPKRHLTMMDISFHKDSVEIFIKHSKTDQTSKGATIVIGQTKQNTCPYAIAKKFLYYRRHAKRSDALFRFKDGKLLTRSKLLKTLRHTLNSLKLPAEHFGTHSLRIGAATAAAKAGVAVPLIKALGRWSSDCYRTYIRTPHKKLRALSNKLVSSTS